MRIMISAGEASGDLHAAALTAAIKNLIPEVEIYGMGGDGLRSAGGEVLFDIKDYSVMGFWEVIKSLPKIFRLKKSFEQVMKERKPDCFLTIDYPDFNMRMAAIAHKKNIPVVSFIPPSAWAWRKGRAQQVAQIADAVATIFPFEDAVYREAGAKTFFVGHPLVDMVHSSMEEKDALAFAGKREGHPLVLLMPGSRLMEIEKMLPILLDSAKLLQKKHQEIDFVLPRAGTIPRALLEEKIKDSGLQVRITEGHNYDLFMVADLALATSGTVTLEAALCGLGSVIVYRTGAFNAWIARKVLKIPYIGLPNIVAGRQVMPELLQEDFTPEKVVAVAEELLSEAGRKKMKENLAEVKMKLGEPGALGRVAGLVVKIAGGRV